MLLRLIGAFFRLLFLPLLAWRNARAVPRGSYVAIEIDGGVADIVRAPRFWELLRPRAAMSLHAVRAVVDEVAKDARVAGLLVTIKSLRGGMASATSLRAILGRARDAGKDVVVHLPLGAMTKEAYVASIASRIYLGPQAQMAPLGFATATRYLRAAITRAGLEPEVFARGMYKSAGEQLVRDSMSDPQREQLSALLDVFYTQIVEAFASGRRMTQEQARAVVDAAPYRADEAIAAGLVDGAAYEDEMADRLAQGGTRPRVLLAERYLQVVRATRMKPLRRKPVIGVITVHGAIAGQGGMAQQLATDERVIAAVRRARQNRAVRAVILHVDSPGGSALASDRIHHELEQLAAEKPLVACMANVAASGGYYVAAPAHTIVAQPTTITGSIGVVSARVVVEPLLAKLGVHTEIVKRGARADIFEPTRHLDEGERAAIDRELEGTYQAFLAVVARGRKRPVGEIHRVAQGRVWSGADAAKVGLVDVLGGFEEALDRARALVGAGGAGLEPAIVRGGRTPLPPLDPPKRAAFVEAVTAIAAMLGIDAVALGLLRDPVLAYCPLPAELHDASLS